MSANASKTVAYVGLVYRGENTVAGADTSDRWRGLIDCRTLDRWSGIHFDAPTANRIVISSLVPIAPSAAFGGLIPNADMGNRVSPS